MTSRNEFHEYYQKLYDWLKANNIPYKPYDRTKLNVVIDALLLGDYSDLALCISKKPKYVSVKRHEEDLKLKEKRAKEAGITVIFLNEKDFQDLTKIKDLLDKLKK